MKLGIIGAMDVEVQTLKSQMAQLQITQQAGMEFYEGTLQTVPAVVVQCGVGKVNAAMCTQILCSRYEVTHIINTGIAGSLCAALDIGDLVVSTDVMYHDMDVTALGYPVGKVPGLDVLAFPADDRLRQHALAAAEEVHPGHIHSGRVASGDQFVASREQKDAIIQHTNAVCTEMEGCAIAHTAYRNEIPFVIIRAISDKADDSAQMDYPSFEAAAAVRCAAVITALAEQMAK